jgi:HK97 family phage portal protein
MSWRQAYEGSQNAGRTAILEEGMDYTPITLKPSDASFIETKRTVVADIARIFGVPQFLLEDMERATFNNIEHLSQQFLTLTIRPWCKRLEAEINRKLFTRNEKGRFYAFLDFDDLLVADLTSRANYARTLFNVGALSPNDIRKMSGYNPIEGGDNHYVQVNMADINAMPDPNRAGQVDNVQTLLNGTEEDE